METLETVIRKRIHIHAPDGEAVFHLRAEPSGASLFLSGMKRKKIDCVLGGLDVWIDYSDPGDGLMLMVIGFDGTDSVALLSNDQAEELALALIELVREGKKNG